MTRKFFLFLVIVVLSIVGFLYFWSNRLDNSTNTNNDGFDKSQYSLTDPNSIWVIVNKKNAIPTNFIPKLVVPDVPLRLSQDNEQMHISSQAKSAAEELFKSAEKQGIQVVFGSGYRSAEKQKELYDLYVEQDGRSKADKYSARPGHSEHQTGLAIDFISADQECYLEICWANTTEGKWVAKNAYKFGFILRYQKGKEKITGYEYEPWHFRFVGKDLAGQIHQTGQTLEEFFGLEPAHNY